MLLNFNHNMENESENTFEYTFEILIKSKTRFEEEDIERSLIALQALLQGYTVNIPEKMQKSQAGIKYKMETVK